VKAVGALLIASGVLLAAPAEAESWGKSVRIDREGNARATPETAMAHGVKLEPLSPKQFRGALILAGILLGWDDEAKMGMTQANLSDLSLGRFPRAEGAGELKWGKASLDVVREKLQGCELFQPQSLGIVNGVAAAMVAFTCPHRDDEWRNAVIGVSFAEDKLSYVINLGDLPNIRYASPTPAAGNE
jgi:hypothetical protein